MLEKFRKVLGKFLASNHSSGKEEWPETAVELSYDEAEKLRLAEIKDVMMTHVHDLRVIEADFKNGEITEDVYIELITQAEEDLEDALDCIEETYASRYKLATNVFA